MLPSIRQRLIIACGLALGGACWLASRGMLSPADGSTGLSLFDARVGIVPAVVCVALAGIPALALGLLSSATGNPLSGVFTVAASLLILAGQDGSMSGWIRRTSLPDGYALLAAEMLIWQLGVVVILVATAKLRSPMRSRWPALAFDDHLGVDTRIHFPQALSLAGGATCALVAGVLSFFLIRSDAAGQVIGALITAFAIGATVAQMVFPQPNPVGILFSPAIVAMAAYGYVLFSFGTHDEVLAAWFAQTSSSAAANARLPGPAMALPIHYASAALAGCAIGVGMAQAFDAARVQATEA